MLLKKLKTSTTTILLWFWFLYNLQAHNAHYTTHVHIEKKNEIKEFRLSAAAALPPFVAIFHSFVVDGAVWLCISDGAPIPSPHSYA